VIADEALMLACRDGSVEAFEQLFGRYRMPVWGYFRRRLSDAARAEDLAQETFVAVLKGAVRYEPRALFRTYLFTIAFNLLSAERRRLRARPAMSLDDAALVDLAADPHQGLWVRQAVGRLEEMDREVVMLREFEELSYAQIATLLNLPLNTVRSRLFRARTELRRLLIPETHTQGHGS
jgi:RNA polymerase sigma-70 factor (ECF subfamily)